MDSIVDKKHLYTYLGFAYGLAWLVGLIVYLTGGLVNSPEVFPGSRITLALLLISLGYMWAPALANIFTRLVTHQGWDELNLAPQFKKSWKYWLAAWVGPAIMTIVGGIVFFLIFPSFYDANLSTIQKMLDATPSAAGVSPWLIILGQVISAILVAPVINSFFTFGEEFGWRGYMLPLLLPLGEKKAFLVSGVIWGLWHAPVIAMGHNYGLDYPGAPWLGILAMVWFCTLAGTFLGWVSIKSKSVLPAVIGHAATNGIAGLAILFTLGKPNMLLGPSPVGLIGSIGFLAVFCLIFFRREDTSKS
jgi:uncharacterized protein